MKALIGIDIGTTNIKGVVFGLAGQALVKATTPSTSYAPQPRWAYYKAEEIWAAICRVTHELMAALPEGAVPVGAAFSSMAETAVPLDAHNQPTHNAIAWFDQRTVPQAEWWRKRFPPSTIERITGLPVRPLYGLMKLLWIRDNAPDAFAATRRWLNMADYAAFRLCGVQATDYSLASRMLALDLAQKKWSDTILDGIQLDKSLLAEAVPSGTRLGTVHAEAAAATGLPVGLPVSSGGHDHVCGALALGLTEPGDVFDSMGTAESIMVTTAVPLLDASLTKRNVGQGVHVVPNRTYTMSGAHMSGGSVDWIRRILLGTAFGQAASTEAYETLVQLASEVPAGSNGLYFVPHLRRANPPYNDNQARGMFVGATADMGTGHFARAVLEGIAYEYQQAFENVLGALGLEARTIVATGGGTRNELLMGIKTAVSGLPITIPQVDEAVCLGAAMLAGVGAGVYSSFADAAEQVQIASRTIAADADRVAFYRKRFTAVYQKLYPAMRDIHHVISDLEANSVLL